MARVAALLLGLLVAVPAPAAEPTGTITGTVVAPVPKHKANTVVFVKNAGLGAAKAKVTMDQKGLVFIPRVLPIQKGTTVEFANSDPLAHNVFTPDGDDKYDLGTWPQGEVRSYTFEKPGVFRQLCRVHDDMIAYIVVLESQHFATSDKAGAFTLTGLPPGTYTLGVWHEKLAAQDMTVEVKAGAPTSVEIKLDAKK